MSKLTNCVKKGTLWSVIVAVVIALGIVISAICGFNASASLKDSKTLTVTMNRYVFNNQLDTVEDICEGAIGDLKVLYEMKSAMSGDDCEIVYVFNSDVDLTNVEDALKNAFKAQTADGGELAGAFIYVSQANEEVVSVLAKGFVLRAVIATVVMAVLAFAYVAIRHSLGMGIVAAVSAIVGAGATFALIALTRIPVTSSVAYVIAVGGLLSLVMTVLTLNKVHAKLNANEPIEETVVKAIPVSENLSLAVVGAGAMLIVGLLSLIGAGAFSMGVWFAITAIIAIAVAAFVGVVYAPSLYVILKGCVDKNLGNDAKSDYIGAKKTSTKVKKIFAKKEEVKEEAPVEEAQEETPCCCCCDKDCENAEVSEEATEAVEVEETEETVEVVEVAEEVVEETQEEATATEENND